jgi:hypothetical protein
MHSAFERGVELLSELESDPVQSQGHTVENPSESASGHMEGIGGPGVPKNVTRLKPVISELTRKVIMVAI